MALDPNKSLSALFPTDKDRHADKTISKGLWLHRLVAIGGGADDIEMLKNAGYIQPYFTMGGVALTEKGAELLSKITAAASN